MKAEELKKEIRKLAVSEKLILVEDLWDDIASSANVLPLREWQKQELDSRLEEYSRGSLKLIDRESAHKALKDKY